MRYERVFKTLVSFHLAALAAGCGPGSAAAPPPAQAPPWVAFGDSITAWSFRAEAPPGAPAILNAGTPGDDATGAVAKVNAMLAAHPDARGIVMGFGTNDAFRGNTPGPFKEMMGVAVDRATAAGKRVLLARAPWSPRAELARVPALNAAIAELEAAKGLPAGPDLYAWFEAHPDQLSADGIHPNEAGYAAIRRLWADAVTRAESTR